MAGKTFTWRCPRAAIRRWRTSWPSPRRWGWRFGWSRSRVTRRSECRGGLALRADHRRCQGVDGGVVCPVSGGAGGVGLERETDIDRPLYLPEVPACAQDDN
ncbi:hypothetical protein KL86PLE_90586 [uncultured Pleomorphomonas sp.]|uniref:Uncharacterized protein n=1 Tax=uncultured Pleomorphomonas sp. TaxID=442121 RepID=A0A212LQ28_9HYPH|nr:hypothetical protein KL86PLE_90586 [uncultured Pleomorphomonas sp.]